MTNPTFVNREDELEALRSRYDREQAEFIVVYRENKASASGLDPEGEADT